MSATKLMGCVAVVIGLLTGAGRAANISLTNPDPATVGQMLPIGGYQEEVGNYSVSMFNALSFPARVNLNFDGANFTSGDRLDAVTLTDFEAGGNSGVNLRVNNSQVSGGPGQNFWGLILSDANTDFHSSAEKSLRYQGGTAVFEFLESVVPGNPNPLFVAESVYGVGLTINRLQAPGAIRLFLDQAGTQQIGSDFAVAANSTGTNQSFFGYAGMQRIRRVEFVQADGTLTNQYALDDLTLITTPIDTSPAVPEPTAAALLVIGALGWGVRRQR